MYIVLITLLLASLALSAVLVLTLRHVSRRTGFLDRPGERKIQTRPVPYGGGLAIFLGTLLPIVAASLLVSYLRARGIPVWAPAMLSEVWVHLSGAVSRFTQLYALLLGATFMLMLGLADDVWKLPAGVKLLLQGLIAAGMVMVGVRITALVGSGILGSMVTLVWIVAITNAFNFLDNMDGLSAGVALIVACILAVVALISGQFFIAALLAPLVGALAGFLVFNYPPASIYMGDAGSLFIGFLVAVLAVLVTFYEGPTPSFRPVLLPLLLFSVPIYDMLSVIIIRLRAGLNPMRGDRRHFSHRLVALGLSPVQAVLVIHLLTLGVGLSAVLLYLYRDTTGEIISIVQALVILSAVAIIERAGFKEVQP